MKDQIPAVNEQVELLYQCATVGSHRCHGIIQVARGIAGALQSVLTGWIVKLNGVERFQDKSGVHYELMFSKDTPKSSTVIRTVKAMVSASLSESVGEQLVQGDARSRQLQKEKEFLDHQGFILAERQARHAKNIMQFHTESVNLKIGHNELMDLQKTKALRFYDVEVEQKKSHLEKMREVEMNIQTKALEVRAEIQKIEDALVREENLRERINLPIDEEERRRQFAEMQDSLTARYGHFDWRGLTDAVNEFLFLQARNPTQIKTLITGLDMIIAPLVARMEDMEALFEGMTEERTMPIRVLKYFADQFPESVDSHKDAGRGRAWQQIVRHLTPRDTVDDATVDEYSTALQLHQLVLFKFESPDEWKKRCEDRKKECRRILMEYLSKKGDYIDLVSEVERLKIEMEQLSQQIDNLDGERRLLRRNLEQLDPDTKLATEDKLKDLEAEKRSLERELQRATHKLLPAAEFALDLQMRRDHDVHLRIVHEKVTHAIFDACMRLILSGGAVEFFQALTCVKQIFTESVIPHMVVMNNVVKHVLEGNGGHGTPAISDRHFLQNW